MKIEFEYIDNMVCNLLSNEHPAWGCCCICNNRIDINKHCCHSPYEGKCICGDSLGFYVCLAFYNCDNTLTANICGKHGICEMFSKIKEQI